jgi:dipeptidyl aminopeptidase/acylaminoacyl peptidase
VTPGWLLDDAHFVVNAGTERGADASIWIAGVADAPRKIREGASAVSISPDGAWIAFVSASDRARAGARALWLMDRDGGQARQLFTVPAGRAILEVSWSPDSQRVAYGLGDANGVPVAIETRDLAGGASSIVFQPRESEVLQGSAWLRDGRFLFSLAPSGVGRAAVMSPVLTGRCGSITTAAHSPIRNRWPDGCRSAWRTQLHGRQQERVVSADGASRRDPGGDA